MHLPRLLACCGFLCCASLLASPLHIAVRQGNKHALVDLLSKMSLSQIQEPDEEGDSALDLARTFEDVDMMMLIEEGINEKQNALLGAHKRRFGFSQRPKIKHEKTIKGLPSEIEPIIAGNLAYYFMRDTSKVLDLSTLKVIKTLDTNKIQKGEELPPWLHYWPRGDGRPVGLLDIRDRDNNKLLACQVFEGEGSEVIILDDCVCFATSWTIEFLDIQRRKPLAQIEFGGGTDFRRLARAGNTLYVAVPNLRQVFVVDLRLKSLIHALHCSDGPGQPVVGGRHLFVPITHGRAINVIDTVTNLFVDNILTSKLPFVAPSHSFAYGRCEDGAIFILDGDSLERTVLTKSQQGFDTIESLNLGPYDLVFGSFGKIETLLVDKQKRQVIARFPGNFISTFGCGNRLFRGTANSDTLQVFKILGLQH